MKAEKSNLLLLILIFKVLSDVTSFIAINSDKKEKGTGRNYTRTYFMHCERRWETIAIVMKTLEWINYLV